jgi:cytochrome c peroxidase
MRHHPAASLLRFNVSFISTCRESFSLVRGAVLGAGLTGVLIGSASAQLQVLPQNAPRYMHFAYPSAMSAPLPWSANPGRSGVLPASQAYLDATGQMGILQTQGAVNPANNAFFQSLGSNGRSCFSCHQPANGMSIGNDTLQALFNATGGLDLVFAPVDGSNCPKDVPQSQTRAAWRGGAYGRGLRSAREARSLLLNRGVFRVFLPMPKQADFTISVVSDPYGCNTDPAYAQQVDPTTQEVTQMISVYRRPRMTANMKYVTVPGLTLGGGGLANIDFISGAAVVDPATGSPISGNIMWDGREPTLESQARDATLGHAQALTAPTAAQVAQIVAYETGVFAAQVYDFSAGALNANASPGTTVFGGPQRVASSSSAFGNFALYDAWPTTSASTRGHDPAALGAAARASIARGQALFNTRPITVSNVAGFNNATLLGVTNPSVTTCSSCHGNVQAGNDPFPDGQRDIGIGGQSVAFGGPPPAADLPVFKVTCKAPASTPYHGTQVLTNDPGLALTAGKCADVGRRSVPQLRALAGRAPYFSDGSAATLPEVVKFYNKRFGIGFTAGEMNDLVNFLGAL